MPTNDAIPGTPDMLVGWRLKIGIALIALMVLLWLLIPIEAAFKISGGAIAATTAVIAITNTFIFVIAVVAMGRPGFAFLKARAFPQAHPASGSWSDAVSDRPRHVLLVHLCKA